MVSLRAISQSMYGDSLFPKRHAADSPPTGAAGKEGCPKGGVVLSRAKILGLRSASSGMTCGVESVA